MPRGRAVLRTLATIVVAKAAAEAAEAAAVARAAATVATAAEAAGAVAVAGKNASAEAVVSARVTIRRRSVMMTTRGTPPTWLRVLRPAQRGGQRECPL